MPESIAIISTAFRFPGGSNSPAKLWELLKEPRDILKPIDESRLRLSKFHHNNGEHHGSTDVQGASYTLEEDCRLFDASFFGISPLEADIMDPQQRILLEVVYEAFEAAGYSLDQMQGSQTSVHVGVMNGDYYDLQMRDPETLPTHTATGTARSILSNRISYAFDLRGASMTIDTACSSSLVALHQAVQGLRNGEATMAVVGGANLLLDPLMYIAESNLHMLSPDSRCKMWDKSANGYARGEGFAAVLLKPLKDAIRDGDHIEGVIRETAVNSDGRTKGITMPSPTAQAAMIRQAYKNAGLDPTVDRCQYFECHGTGTQADDAKLYVGSIKTIIGHLEGCAGLAGLIKALLAMKHHTIPPNLHFKELSSKVEPFYHNLQIPTKAIPWPETSDKCLRASVNSFGFGGTNAHVILESYEDEKPAAIEIPDDKFIGPLVLSASTGISLIESVKSYADRIRSDPSLDLENLSWILQKKRSSLSSKIFFSGATRQRLIDFMDRFVEDSSSVPPETVGNQFQPIDPNETPGILGVFTGQGAQWASMGRGLWSLTEQLLADEGTSRISEAEISQPICTALQIALVDLLIASGVKLDAVVGHSSGEIAATYAAGIINLENAMQIAYYRGFHSHLAKKSVPGAMMAVGLSFADAYKFCHQPEYFGRLKVAASNSPLSVTLSGDADAIMQAKAHFDEKAYLKSLLACDIQIQSPREDCIWTSSVRGDTDLLEDGLEPLKGQYWVDNLLGMVQFSQAVEHSIWHGGPFNVAIEIGPHPALKGPAEQTLKTYFGTVPNYAGLMRRGDDEVEAFSGALGYVWSYLGSSAVDFDGYRKAFDRQTSSHLLKDLPSYGWDHRRAYWRESRVSRNYRLRNDKSHELLGRRTPDDSDQELRWRNIVRLHELPWIQGHLFQGQVLFPGAGYIVMALQAGAEIADQRAVELYEVTDISMDRAMVIPEGTAGVETLFTARLLEKQSSESLSFEFACYFCNDENNGQPVKAAYGRLTILFGESNTQHLPPRLVPASNLVPIDMDRFYTSMTGVGQEYLGVFRSIKEGRRALGFSSTVSSWETENLKGNNYVMHPGFLDVALQTLYVSFASPASGGYWAPYLPVKVGRLSVNPHATYSNGVMTEMEADSFVTTGSSTLLKGDIHVYPKGGAQTTLQIEGLEMKAVSEPQASNDKHLFSETVWRADSSFTLVDLDTEIENLDDIPLMEALDRTAVYYYRKFLADIGSTDRKTFACDHPVIKPEWLEDSAEVIEELNKTHGESVHLKLIRAVGDNLLKLVAGKVQILEVMIADDMLNRFYVEGYNFSILNNKIGQAMKQITFKNPQAVVLEIGAGTGGTTRSVFDAIDNAYSSYTFTDISTGFFENAEERFRDHSGKMTFKVLDIEKDPQSQGFTENTYDVIIAANVFHATRTLGDTMRHVRSLLKPGGFLLMLEVTGPELLRTHFIMGALSGWWLGGDDGRVLSPALTASQWDELLQETGFSGVDTIFYDTADEAQHSVSFVLSRATDSQVELLRNPHSRIHDIQGEQPILIVGGKSLFTTQIVTDVQKSLSHWKKRIIKAKSLDDVPVSTLVPGTSVLFLGDLDKQVFSDMTPERLMRLQSLFLTSKNVLWVTEGRTAKNPEANMIVGVGRTLWTEMAHLKLQFLDIDIDVRSRDISKIITQTFLRLEVLSHPEYDGENSLWQIEPELIYDGEKMLISRILPNKALNDRHNASRRPIKQTLDLQTAAVDIVQEGKSFVLVPSAPSAFTEDDKIQVKYSLSLYNDTQYPVLLNIGSNSHTGETVISLSTSCSSTLDAANSISLGDVPCNAQVLESIACNILLDLTRSKIPTKGTVLFYEPPKALVHQLQSDAYLKNKEFRFVSTGPKQRSPDWIQLFPRASQTANRLLLPLDTSCVIKFQNASSFNLESVLPSNTSILGVSDVLHEFQSKLHKRLPTFLSNLHQLSSDLIHTQMMTVSSLLESSPESLPSFFIIDWSDSGLLNVALKPLDVSKAFSSNKTYLLVGMTKELGLSLAQWMVKNGARHLALTSRTGSVEDPGWVPAMKAHGANVQLFSMDVADLESVTGVVETINKTMPPIAGVCNAAMVLSDGLFADMSFDVLQNTLKPKVDGSRNLDQVFYDTPLDFFVLFSSMASIIGNPGQSNYHAANLYMEGLCGQRRSRGLAASAMHIGMVADIGYVARRGQSMEDHLRKMFFLPLSESDVHQLFAESILASQDTVYGLEPFVDSPEAPKRPPWEGNPRFSHFMRKEASSNEVSKDRALDTDYKQRLQSDEPEDSLIDMVQQVFGRKLEAMMQLSANSINLNVPLIDLGVDSLLAVEIRSWFLKKLGMDVPVLKVLSGDTTAQLCEDATRRFLGLKLKQNSASKPEQHTASNSSGHEDDSAHSSGDSISVPDIHTPNEECSQNSFNSEAEIMSHAQSRLYVAQNYVNDPTTYNVTVTYQIRGNLQIPRFKQALNSVMTHHESLRTCFFKDENTGLLKQGVLPSPSYYLRIVQSKQDDAVDREIALFKAKHWNLEHGRTFGVSLIVQSPEVSTIIFGYHHLVMDGVSWHLFLRDLSTAYQLRPLVKTSSSYIQFAKKQQTAIESGDFAGDLLFWKQLHDQPAEPLQLLPITSVVARKPLTQYASHVQSRVIDTELVSRIKQASKALRVTPFHFHLSIVQLILSRFLALDDICIGVTDANRLDEDFSETVGFFLNLLPLRFQVDQNNTFGQLAANTSRKALEGLAHSAVPFDVILDHLDVARSPAYSPLFQVAVNYRVGALLKTSMGDCEIELTQVEDAKNPYDISFGVTEITSGTCLIELTCQNALYTVEDSQTLMDIYIHLLETLSSNTDLKVKDCPLFDSKAISQAIELGKGPNVSYNWPPTLSARFNEVQRAYPDDIAVKDGFRDASYSQLSSEANGIAQLILAQGGSPGAHVAVLCEPSVDSVASMLAILQAGCVYIPLDLSLPAARHISILNDSDPAFVIVHEATKEAGTQLIAASQTKAQLLNVSDIKAKDEPVSIQGQADSPAFILYTSGSTGKPKGVVLSQANFANHLAVKTQELLIERELVLQQSSLGFDMSIIQTFVALANGGKLVIASREKRGDPIALSELMQKEGVTFTIATPTEYLMLLRNGEEHLKKCTSWQQACMGGEVVSSQLLHQFRSSQVSVKQLTNCYGPTEITAAATFQDLSPALTDTSFQVIEGLIGKVLPNYSVKILDTSGNAVPLGVCGEIAIGGQGVASGYLHLHELTAEKFVLDSRSTQKDARMYRTGDKGRLRRDGSLEFLGRLDQDSQIKLRGLRIELGEIEHVLVQAGEGLFSDVVVTVKGDPAVLVAYVVLNKDRTADRATLQAIISKLPLPQYMIPAAIQVLERLPTNASGKTDRKAVASLDFVLVAEGSHSNERLDLSEGELLLLWQKVLPNTNEPHILDRNSDFFLHGGNSLLLMKLQGAIKDSMDISVPISELYQVSTLGKMAAHLRNKRDELATEFEPIDWELETAIPDHILAISQDSQLSTQLNAGGHEIVLTGSTSFLGAAILKALLKEPTVKKVHCITVPSDQSSKLPVHPKVVQYQGTLLSPTLGLSETERLKLQTSATCIIHAGANGHCLNNYSSLRVPNVQSTHFLASLALPRAIPIHFISSNRVALLSGSMQPAAESMSKFTPRTDGAEGFTVAKWASERFLETLAEKAHVPVTIHRHCILTGDEAPNEDAVNDVHAAAANIAANILSEDSTDRGVRFIHHSSGVKVPISDFKKHLEKIYSGVFEEVTMDEWIGKVLEAGIDPLITSYLQAMAEKEEVIQFPFLGVS
ncbi:AMP-binding enzyme domain-containing protein [Trichoderma breve]|uniref:AMP-binding enzyme domain-containing protein n=1 Tax=Trichoderma breve TaxID=2034170 RepID=A0A9W9E741_9HYPO|nr:AMP-binding enzyme domain-containing protein [Trichoderma breve]KAJ4861498.1 AMP-binding enzyme domain-containing protein [Trichoderma breve]